MNLGDFFLYLGKHLEAQHLSQSSKNSISRKMFFSNLQLIFVAIQAKWVPLILSINTNIYEIFVGLEDHFWSLE